MPQNARLTALTVSKLLRENQQGVKLKLTPPTSSQIRVKTIVEFQNKDFNADKPRQYKEVPKKLVRIN